MNIQEPKEIREERGYGCKCIKGGQTFYIFTHAQLIRLMALMFILGDLVMFGLVLLKEGLR